MSALDPISWAIILMIIGCGLIVLEVFVPSGGILGFLALTAILGSIFMAFRSDMSSGFGFIGLAMVGVPLVIGLAFKYWPHTPMGKAFLGELPEEDEIRPNDWRRDLVGRVGIAKSKMLPSGSVFVDGRMVDAVSNGAAIEEDEPVVVVEVRGNRVVVRQADPHEAQQKTGYAEDVLETPIEDLGFDSLEDPLA